MLAVIGAAPRPNWAYHPSSMSEAVAIIVGSTVSAVVALAVVFVQSLLERRSHRRDETSNRLAEFAAASYAAAVRTRSIAVASMNDKDSTFESEIFNDSADRVNDVLAKIVILDSPDTIRAAIAVDRELSRLDRVAMSRVWSDGAWRSERRKLGDMIDSFQRTSRQELKVPELPPDIPRFLPSDPITVTAEQGDPGA